MVKINGKHGRYRLLFQQICGCNLYRDKARLSRSQIYVTVKKSLFCEYTTCVVPRSAWRRKVDHKRWIIPPVALTKVCFGYRFDSSAPRVESPLSLRDPPFKNNSIASKKMPRIANSTFAHNLAAGQGLNYYRPRPLISRTPIRTCTVHSHVIGIGPAGRTGTGLTCGYARRVGIVGCRWNGGWRRRRQPPDGHWAAVAVALAIAVAIAVAGRRR